MIELTAIQKKQATETKISDKKKKKKEQNSHFLKKKMDRHELLNMAQLSISIIA